MEMKKKMENEVMNVKKNGHYENFSSYFFFFIIMLNIVESSNIWVHKFHSWIICMNISFNSCLFFFQFANHFFTCFEWSTKYKTNSGNWQKLWKKNVKYTWLVIQGISILINAKNTRGLKKNWLVLLKDTSADLPLLSWNDIQRI